MVNFWDHIYKCESVILYYSNIKNYKKEDKKMKQKTVNLDWILHKKLKKRAVEKDSTIHNELNKILEDKLEEDGSND